jgi:hypothetical protein
MKATDVINDRCRCCKGEMAKDVKNRGWRRHKHRKSDGSRCPFGLGEKD